ncbi:hypothetical protein TNCV_2445961 [Trichonephila clavipes]|nr:hypothetical protein TNCV_2445961 [Trichonephila clavipes]
MTIILEVNPQQRWPKPGRSRIFTDTPEKEEIKNIMLLKSPTSPKKRKLVKKHEFEIKATTSKESSDIEDSHSTDDANSTVVDSVGMNCHSGPKVFPRGFNRRRDKAPSQLESLDPVQSVDRMMVGNLTENLN